MRLDSFITEKFNLKSRTYANRIIKDGLVSVDSKTVTQPSKEIIGTEVVELIKKEAFASFGGEKLKKAIEHFNISVTNKFCVDIGCSNGGFTDCLLKNGASKVIAVDVGECALPNELLCDSRVSFIKFNARNLSLDQTKNPADFVCLDCSFISLKLLLKSVCDVLKEGGEAVLLIKPQFEVGKKALSKNGIVTDKKAEEFAVVSIEEFAKNIGFIICGITESPKKDTDKNTEYLLYVKKQTHAIC